MTPRMSRGNTKILWLTTVLAPTLVVQVVQLLAGADGPATVSAQTPPDAPAPSASDIAPPKAPGPTQVAAIDYLRATPINRAMTSPMDEPPQPREQARAPEPEPPAPNRPSPVPKLRISAIVGSKTETVTAIGHRICRVGDSVADGWTIVSIDPVSRVVRIVHADGRTADLSTADETRRPD